MRCPLCETERFQTIERFPVHLVVCERCSLVFIQDRKEEPFYKDLYSQHYGYVQKAKGDRRDLSYGRWIKRYLPEGKTSRILEVGCGSGSLLESLRDGSCDVYGIEPGKQAAQYARNVRGLAHIENSFLEESRMPENYFDGILLLQTFEHFADPVGCLDRIRGLLKEDGLLLMEVPDAFAVIGVYQWGMEPSHNHLYIYSALTLRLLLKKCGFDVCDLRKRHFSLRVVAKKSAPSALSLHRYKNHYKKFLFVNLVNKHLLRLLYRLRLAQKITRSRLFRYLFMG
jgi:2-polyprenyl-3-methyl-5-hydroxy-6-metoxy-1,4-benzoquinol methylase